MKPFTRQHRRPVSPAESSTSSAGSSHGMLEQSENHEKFGKRLLRIGRDMKRKRTRWFWVFFLSFVSVNTLLTGLFFVQLPNSHSAFPRARNNDWQSPITNVSRWLDDYTSTVIPLPCHSHNDYWRTHPLFSAIADGCVGIEADVWLGDNDQDLLVGHSRASLSPAKTLDAMYLDPLLEMITYRNQNDTQYNDNPSSLSRGIFLTRPNVSISLMIDVKEKPAVVWPIVIQKLEAFRQKQFLTRYQHDASSPNNTLQHAAMVVLGSGELTLDVLQASYPNERNMSFSDYHDTFLDAPLVDVQRQTDGKYSDTNSYYASTSFKEAIGSVRFGFSKQQLETLRAQIRAARMNGLVSRYWDIPSWPVSYQDYIWSVLTREDVGILSVDDLDRATQGMWMRGYITDVIWVTVLAVYLTVLSIGIGIVGYRTRERNSKIEALEEK